MSERARELDLEAGDVTDGEAEDPTHGHHSPKLKVSQPVESGQLAQLPEHEDERDEEEARVDVVVVGQLPDASIHSRHHFLSVDGIQRDTGTRQHAEKHP